MLVKIHGVGNLTETQLKNLVKSDIENFKWLFQIEDDGGIGGKCICVERIVINEELSNC